MVHQVQVDVQCIGNSDLNVKIIPSLFQTNEPKMVLSWGFLVQRLGNERRYTFDIWWNTLPFLTLHRKCISVKSRKIKEKVKSSAFPCRKLSARTTFNMPQLLRKMLEFCKWRDFISDKAYVGGWHN